MYHGIINVYKEEGYTSHDVVAVLRRLLKQKKIGHTGTLDPNARGVLPICLGIGTKASALLTDSDKAYEAVLLLGRSTDTQDIWGELTKDRSCKVASLSEEDVRRAAASFVGEGWQMPPMYSAIKQNGKKLYELAREGKVVPRPLRRVCFYEIDIVWIDMPRVCIRVSCSKGSYIRTLCHDIGELLGCGGCMESLLRIKAGPFRIEDSLSLAEIEQAVQSGAIDDRIVPVDELFLSYPSFIIPESLDIPSRNGHPLRVGQVVVHAKEPGDGTLWRGLTRDGRMLGLYERTGELFRLKTMFLVREEENGR